MKSITNMTQIVGREDKESQFIDYLRHKYPSRKDFTQYVAKCSKRNSYKVVDYLSNLDKDMRRLILDYLTFPECIKLASTCRKLFSIVGDNCYWFRRHKRDFYCYPMIGSAEAVISVARRRNVIPIRSIDVYQYTRLYNQRRGRTLQGYLQKCHGYHIVSLPKKMQKPDLYWNLRLPISAWPTSIVKAAALSSNKEYSLIEVGTILKKWTRTELEPLDKLRLAHIWENASYACEAGETKKVKII